MVKSLIRVFAGALVVPFSGKATVINTGRSPIFVCSQQDSDLLKSVEVEEELIVKQALYSIAPNQSKPLPSGSYDVDFNNSVDASALMLLETPEPKKKPVKPTEPEKPAESNSDAN